MRKDMRAIGACMICGKNTMMKAAITAMNTPPEEGDEDYEERKDTFVVRPHLEKIINQLKGNTSIIFHNGDLLDVQKILESQVREAPARIGAIAPKDVIIKAGGTGLDPRQTGFFGNLGIATKIVKAQIEILNDFHIIHEGDKITPGQSALLDKLKIRPFYYKMSIKKVMQDGMMYDPACLNISTEDVLAKFTKGCGNITALSLGSGYVTPAAAPHLVMHAFKNLAAVAFATDFSFPQAEALKSAAAAGAAATTTAAVAEDKPAAKEAEKEASEEEDDAADGAFNMFGDDDEY